jgi:HSP20 family protein
MNLMKRTPFRDFENFMTGLRWPVLNDDMDLAAFTKWQPSVDITEADKEFLIKVEIPEVKKEDLKIEVENGLLTIRGERREERKDEKRHRTERYYGSFERSFTLPEGVRENTISADMKNGMLYVHLAKADLPKGAKKQEIKIA